jgi:hypothetical protein
LNIESNDAPGWAGAAGELQGKEAHAGSWLDHRHARVDVWSDDRCRILNEPPEGGPE